MTKIDPDKLMMLRDLMAEAREKADALYEQSQDAGIDAARAYDRFVSYAQHGDNPPTEPGLMLGASAVEGYPIDPRKYNKNISRY